MPQEASRLLQDGLLEPIWTQHGPKLAPSWLKLGLCWPQVGSNLAQVGAMLGPFPSPQPPLGQPKPFQSPSLLPLGLPNPYKTQNGLQKGLPSLQLGPYTPNLESKILQNVLQKVAFQAPSSSCPRIPTLLPGPGGWGVASFIYQWW